MGSRMKKTRKNVCQPPQDCQSTCEPTLQWRCGGSHVSNPALRADDVEGHVNPTLPRADVHQSDLCQKHPARAFRTESASGCWHCGDQMVMQVILQVVMAPTSGCSMLNNHHLSTASNPHAPFSTNTHTHSTHTRPHTQTQTQTQTHVPMFVSSNWSKLSSAAPRVFLDTSEP